MKKLEMDGGDGYTTTNVFMPQIYALTNGRFYVQFTTQKKGHSENPQSLTSTHIQLGAISLWCILQFEDNKNDQVTNEVIVIVPVTPDGVSVQ